LAERGFADRALLAPRRRLGWPFRLQLKANFGVVRPGSRPCKGEAFTLAPGRARFLPHGAITAARFGPVSRALARHASNGECGYVVSEEPTSGPTFVEYGGRVDMEENFLDDKSNGFQLESSRGRAADALSRLWLVLAVTTGYLVAQGTQVVATHNRRWVAPHWLRGNSYWRMGWQWVQTALARGWPLFATRYLSGASDPEPARASAAQSAPPPPVTFTQTFFYLPA
jgi:hypothetical protein